MSLRELSDSRGERCALQPTPPARAIFAEGGTDTYSAAMVRPSQILLASGSPRRRDLLQAAGLEVRLAPPNIEEVWPGGTPEESAIRLAQQKLDAVPDPGLTLAADTVVVLDEVPLGKPATAEEAREMLARLAGRTHRVITGFCLRHGERRHAQAVATEVTFRPLTQGEIERYVARGECLDKAGAYGIQGQGGALVHALRGSYTNVVGLPLQEVLEAMEALAEGAS